MQTIHGVLHVQAQHVLLEAKARLEGSMLEGSTNDVVKGITYIQVLVLTRVGDCCWLDCLGVCTIACTLKADDTVE